MYVGASLHRIHQFKDSSQRVVVVLCLCPALLVPVRSIPFIVSVVDEDLFTALYSSVDANALNRAEAWVYKPARRLSGLKLRNKASTYRS